MATYFGVIHIPRLQLAVLWPAVVVVLVCGVGGGLVTLRLVATWLAAWSGVPGGVFAPSLTIGAGIGNDVAQLAALTDGSAVLIALGMAAALVASLISRSFSRPLYIALADAQLKRLP